VFGPTLSQDFATLERNRGTSGTKLGRTNRDPLFSTFNSYIAESYFSGTLGHGTKLGRIRTDSSTPTRPRYVTKLSKLFSWDTGTWDKFWDNWDAFGKVILSPDRGKTDGVDFQIKADNQPDWTGGGRFFKSPAILNIPDGSGLPRAVQIRALYLQGNAPVGQNSDTVNVVTQP
jgi:hypothetical protein